MFQFNKIWTYTGFSCSPYISDWPSDNSGNSQIPVHIYKIHQIMTTVVPKTKRMIALSQNKKKKSFLN